MSTVVMSAYSIIVACSGGNENAIVSKNGSNQETLGAAPQGQTEISTNEAYVKLAGQWQKGRIEDKGKFVIFNGHYRIPKEDVIPTSLFPKRNGDLGLVGYSTLDGKGLDKAHLWPGGIIPYSLDGLDSRAKNAFLKAVQEYHKKTVLKFVDKTKLADKPELFLTFEVDPKLSGGAYVTCAGHCSNNDFNKMIIAEDILDDVRLYGVMLHELAHTAGMLHEFDRPNISDFVRIDDSNLNERGKEEKNGTFGCYFNPRNLCQGVLGYGKLDFNSVVMYPSYIFSYSKNKSKPVLYREQNGKRRYDLGGYALSKGDIRSLAYLYQGVEGINPPLISKYNPENLNSMEELDDIQVDPGKTVSFDFQTVNVPDCSTAVTVVVDGAYNSNDVKLTKKDLNGKACNVSFRASPSHMYGSVLLTAYSATKTITEKAETNCRWRRSWAGRRYVCDKVDVEKTVPTGTSVIASVDVTIGTPSRSPKIYLLKDVFFPDKLAAGQPISLDPLQVEDDKNDTREVRVVGGDDANSFVGMDGKLYTTEKLEKSEYKVKLQVLDRNGNESNVVDIILKSSAQVCSQEVSDKIHDHKTSRKISLDNELSKSEDYMTMHKMRSEAEKKLKAERQDIGAMIAELENEESLLKKLAPPSYPHTLASNNMSLGELRGLLALHRSFEFGWNQAKNLSQYDIDEAVTRNQRWTVNQINSFTKWKGFLVPYWGQGTFDAKIKELEEEKQAIAEKVRTRIPEYDAFIQANVENWDKEHAKLIEQTNARNEEIAAQRDELQKKIAELKAKKASMGSDGRFGYVAISSEAVEAELANNPDYQQAMEMVRALGEDHDNTIETEISSMKSEANCSILRARSIPRPPRIRM